MKRLIFYRNQMIFYSGKTFAKKYSIVFYFSKFVLLRKFTYLSICGDNKIF